MSSAKRPSSLYWIEDALYVAKMTLTCSRDMHQVGVLTRDREGLSPNPAGEVSIPGHPGPSGVWADGAGHMLHLRAGALVLADDGVTPIKWTARCRKCRGTSASPQIRWARLVAMLNQHLEAGERFSRESLRF